MFNIEHLEDDEIPNEGGSHYLYLVTVNAIPRYIGKGTGQRYKHAISGKSSCLALNAAFFEGENIRVYRSDALSNMTAEDAEHIEKRIISTFGPLLLNTHKYKSWGDGDYWSFIAAQNFCALMGSEDYVEINPIDNDWTDKAIFSLAAILPAVFSEEFKEYASDHYPEQASKEMFLGAVEDFSSLFCHD